MQVIAKLFGAVREAAGAKELSLALSGGATVRDVWALLLDEHPAIAPFADRLAVSVNLKDVSSDIKQGKGSLGLLLKDESLYREATRLFESFREAGEIARENAPIASLVSFTSLFFSALN